VAKLLPLCCRQTNHHSTHFLRRPLKSSASQNLRGSPIKTQNGAKRGRPPMPMPHSTFHRQLPTNNSHTPTPSSLQVPSGFPWEESGRTPPEDAEAWNPGSHGLQWPISKPPKEPVSHPGQGCAPPWPGPCLRYRHRRVSRYVLRRGPPNPLEQCSSRLPESLLHLSGEGRHFSHARRLTFQSKHASSP
ncbi:hypothetical protein CORC01_00901, partial [Colletotrichum orchidophilum]